MQFISFTAKRCSPFVNFLFNISHIAIVITLFVCLPAPFNAVLVSSCEMLALKIALGAFSRSDNHVSIGSVAERRKIRCARWNERRIGMLKIQNLSDLVPAVGWFVVPRIAGDDIPHGEIIRLILHFMHKCSNDAPWAQQTTPANNRAHLEWAHSAMQMQFDIIAKIATHTIHIGNGYDNCAHK